MQVWHSTRSMQRMPDLKGVAASADPAIVSFFDRRASEYDREYDAPTPGGYALRIRRQKVLEMFDRPGGKVLDVGCGPGVMTRDMLLRGCSFWGIDPSPNMIAICRERFEENEDVHFVEGGATSIPLSSAFFDAVLCMGVIDSVRDGRAGIAEMMRVLKPGGTLIVTFTNIWNPYAWWKNYLFYPLVSRWHAWRLDRGADLNPGRIRSGCRRSLYSKRKAIEILRSSGAEIERIQGYYYNLAIAPLDEIFSSAALTLTRNLEEGSLPKPDWLAAGLIVKARKI
jgi:ubiquinone/menaquinone biosynthesis C-methylase UbiE